MRSSHYRQCCLLAIIFSLIIYLSSKLIRASTKHHHIIVEEEKINYDGDPLFRPVTLKILPVKVCSPDQKWLIVVNSQVHQFDLRNVIRSTYGHKKWFEKYKIRTMFVTGKSILPSDVFRLQKEAEYYGDILQGELNDVFKNLTMKDLMWMRYVKNYCPEVEMVFVLNQDMVPNIFWILGDYAKGLIPTRRTFTCSATDGNVYRDPGARWYVSEEAYPNNTWGLYCVGAGYIVSTDLFGDLISAAAAHKHYVPVNEAFITGVLERAVNASYEISLYPNMFSRMAMETEALLLTKKSVLGTYTSVEAMTRIFDELQFAYGNAMEKTVDFRENVNITL